MLHPRTGLTRASIHETDLQGSLALLIEQSDDLRGQLEQPGEICFLGCLFAQLAPVGPVFAKHDISLR
jgi:hypothetical protein